MIYVYDRNVEDFSALENNYPIYRGVSILGNPYTYLPVKDTKAMFQCKTREEAIEKYDKYFDIKPIEELSDEILNLLTTSA